MGETIALVVGALIGGTVGAFHVASSVAVYIPYVDAVQILAHVLGL